MLALSIAATITITVCKASSPRYIFYFIGDGMGMGAIMTGELWKHIITGDTTSTIFKQFPIASFATTYSASSPVTDSAAAGTALSSGMKTRNDMVGMLPDSTAVNSIAIKLQELGYGTGLVTSVAADDATPAAFYAHVPARKMYTDIDADFARSGIDFLAGAGLRGLNKRHKKNTTTDSLLQLYNYKIFRDINAIPDNVSKVILLNNDTLQPSTIGYNIDTRGSGMTLAAMTGAAISHLEKYHPEAFFLMIEGGEIDHAAHANDAASLAWEMMSFDEAIKVAWNFYLAHPDETLIVVTADHNTGGISIGNTATGYNAHFELLTSQKVSKNRFADIISEISDNNTPVKWDEIKNMMTDKLGLWDKIPVTADEEDSLKDAYTATFINHDGKKFYTLYADFDPLTTTAFKIIDNHSGAGWISNNHTGNPVPVFAAGTGAEKFSRMLDNTDIPRIIMSLVSTQDKSCHK